MRAQGNNIKRRKGNVWAFFGIFALSGILVFMLVHTPDPNSGPQCGCSHETYTLTPLDTVHQFALVASVSCLPGNCGEAEQDSNKCQFNVRYEVMIQGWDNGFDPVPTDVSSLVYRNMHESDQELAWSGGDTDDWTGMGEDAITSGEQNYWVPCGTTKAFDVTFTTSEVVRTNPFYRDGDTLPDPEIDEVLKLKTHVVLRCGECGED